VLASLGLEMSLIAEIHQSPESFIDFKNDIRTISAVTACRTAHRHVFFSAVGNESVAAVPCFQIYINLVYEHAFTSSPSYYTILPVIDLIKKDISRSLCPLDKLLSFLVDGNTFFIPADAFEFDNTVDFGE